MHHNVYHNNKIKKIKKTIIYILLISFLLQSCFSYKSIDINSQLPVERKYKIKQSNKYENVRIISTTDSTITVSNNKKTINIIAKKDIKVIKKRHFSVLKTALLPVVVSAVGVVGIIVIGKPDFGPKIGGSIQPPP